MIAVHSHRRPLPQRRLHSVFPDSSDPFHSFGIQPRIHISEVPVEFLDVLPQLPSLSRIDWCVHGLGKPAVGSPSGRARCPSRFPLDPGPARPVRGAVRAAECGFAVRPLPGRPGRRRTHPRIPAALPCLPSRGRPLGTPSDPRRFPCRSAQYCPRSPIRDWRRVPRSRREGTVRRTCPRALTTGDASGSRASGHKRE